MRRATVDSILATIAGRENEPAGEVFRNVKELKDLRFVRVVPRVEGEDWDFRRRRNLYSVNIARFDEPANGDSPVSAGDIVQ